MFGWGWKWQTEARAWCFRQPMSGPHINPVSQCLSMFLSSGTRPLSLLQWLIVVLQHRPSLRRHEAVGRILSLASHLTHPCARDEIIICVAAGKKKKRHISNQWKDAYQQHRKCQQTITARDFVINVQRGEGSGQNKRVALVTLKTSREKCPGWDVLAPGQEPMLRYKNVTLGVCVCVWQYFGHWTHF